jgi:hypothetical protein
MHFLPKRTKPRDKRVLKRGLTNVNLCHMHAGIAEP